MLGSEWVAETLYPAWGQRFRVLRELAHVRSPFQEIRIVETESHGRVMLLDGVVQITEADEFAYQEMITHVPLFAHGAARRVLIIGAGDGGVLRRVLAHRTVEAATMVEIDAEVVRLARAHLPGIGGEAWDDPRARVLIADGIAHVAEAPSGSYDVIIVDSTDPIGVGEVLFTDAFYADCARLVGPGGIVVNQCGVPFMQGDELRDTTLRRARHFADAYAYVAAVPTYVGGFMTLGWSAQDQALRNHAATTLAARAEAAGILGTTRYWSPAVHVAAFALPPYVAALLPQSSIRLR
jgi:spermidine synthase